jgi:NADH:ubiquinone oxidoreductase subunit 6 (subunit J)
MIGYAIGSGLLVQSLSLLVSLFALRKKQPFNSGISYLFVLFSLFFILGIMIGSENESLKVIDWYSFQMSHNAFSLISIGLACIWSIVGIYRLLAQELQIRTLPWVWILFMAFLVFYIHGMIIGNSHNSYPTHHDADPNYLMITAIAICVSLTYCLIFIDDNNPMLLRRLWVYSQEENWQRFLEEIPCWLISLVLAIPPCLYLSLFSPTETSEKLHFYPIPIFLLLLRDIGIVLFFNYAQNPKRALGLSVLYLTFLYWIIPAIFIESGAEIMAALFLPLFAGNLGLAIIFAGGQVGFIGYLVFQRWQKTVNQL